MNTMHLAALILALLVAAHTTSAITESETSLVQLLVMFRHGSRTVLLDYPNDTNQAFWYKYGLGQLAPAGMKLLQDYGTFFNNKYSSFLNPVYNRSRVFARSTDYDRTLQSTTSFLSGIYKPSADQKWTTVDGQSNWYPIPIHTANLSNDNILHANAPCPRYDQLKSEMRSTQEYLNLQASNQGFINNLTKFSGLNNLNQYMIWEVADKYMCQDALGLPTEQYILDNLPKIMEMNDYTFYIDFVTVEMGRLVSGGLLKNIVDNMQSKMKGSTSELFVYGIHDNYVAGMQKILNTSTKFVQPEFASGFVFELRKDSSNNYYVQVFFKNNKPGQAITLNQVTVYGCDAICPFDKFYNLVKDNLVSDFSGICKEKISLYTAISNFIGQIFSWLNL